MKTLIAKISAAAVLALAGLPTVGLAQATLIEPVVRIRVGDLDLERADHARLLKARIDAAGKTMCETRKRQERLDRWSTRACYFDFQEDVDALLTRPQKRALRSVGG